MRCMIILQKAIGLPMGKMSPAANKSEITNGKTVRAARQKTGKII